MVTKGFGISAVAVACMATVGGPAFAQSSVTVYGLIDVGIRVDKTASGTVTGVQSGMQSGNRFGLRGTEELGGGLSANFTLESGFLADTGEMISNGAAGIGFGRQASVGLASTQWGSVGFGRQYNPIFSFVAGTLDPFGFGFVGSIGNSVGLQSGAPARSSNSVTYSSPSMNGLKFDFIYSLGETSTAHVSSRAGDQLGLSFVYTGKSYVVGYSHHRTRGTVNVSDKPLQQRHVIGGNYAIGPVIVYGSYAWNRNDADIAIINRQAFSMGVKYFIGPGAVMAQYHGSNDKTSAGANSRQFAFGYQYFLSKRTDIYAAAAKTWNKRGAAFAISDSTNSSLGTITPGFDPIAYQVAIRHRF
jgi:predicted porin